MSHFSSNNFILIKVVFYKHDKWVVLSTFISSNQFSDLFLIFPHLMWQNKEGENCGSLLFLFYFWKIRMLIVSYGQIQWSNYTTIHHLMRQYIGCIFSFIRFYFTNLLHGCTYINLCLILHICTVHNFCNRYLFCLLSFWKCNVHAEGKY